MSNFYYFGLTNVIVKGFIKEWNKKTIYNRKPRNTTQNNLKKIGLTTFFINNLTERQPFARRSGKNGFEENVIKKKSDGKGQPQRIKII